MVLDDETLVEIGRVTVTATTLEHYIGLLVGVIFDDTSAAATKPGTKQCTELAKRAPDRVSPELAERISEWAPVTIAALQQRHQVIHGVAVDLRGAGNENPVAVLWDYRRDKAAAARVLAGEIGPNLDPAGPSTPAELRQVAAELTAQIVATADLCRAAAVETGLFRS